ncbi:hypothetical protein, partial [Aeromonas jandaei]|uniref:hypothetical protein n=1 Tax=Aeromonas jandaei TaxID=650 RepID=UPI0039874737
LDAVSAHTDCLIQIVKERRSFCCCGSGILLNRLLESSLIFKGFSRLPTRLFALPLAVSMGRIIERLITLARAGMQ